MKVISAFLLTAMVFSMVLNAQKPERVVSFIKEYHDCDWYKTQKELWKKEVKKHRKDADAWMNYYKATRYEGMVCAEKPYFADWGKLTPVLTAILEDMKKAVPESFEYNYLVFNNAEDKNKFLPYLEKAHKIAPDRVEAYPDLVVQYEFAGRKKEMNDLLVKWQKLDPASPGILAWNYNALMPLEPNAIIFTGGDNDTYPKWIMQANNNIRRDVTVINASLILVDSYRDRLFKDAGIAPFTTKIDSTNYMNYAALICEHVAKHSGGRPVYFSLSMYESNYQKLKDSLYLEGLVYKYSPERYDNMAVLRKNYEKIMLLDYIKMPLVNDISQPIVNQTNLNYIAPFLQLYDHYKLSGDDTKAADLASLIRLIADKGGNPDFVKYIDEYFKEK